MRTEPGFLLTGLYSQAHGVVTNGSDEVFRNQPGLRLDHVTFVHLLRQSGYQTGLVVPESLPREERKRRNLQELVKNYYRTLLSVDENVGRILDWLDKNELAKETVVVFTSDNGFFLGEHGLYDKRLMYEASIRVPLLLRYPAKVNPQVDAEHLVVNIDFAPTILELAGIPVPTWIHGRSMVPLINATTARPPWRDAFYYQFFELPDADHCARKHRGIRTNRWKLIQFYEQPEEWELYDLQKDPHETRNLYGNSKNRTTVADLKSRMEKLRREVGDEDPPGPPPVAASCHGK